MRRLSRPRSPRAAASWTRRSDTRATRGRDSTTTRTTNRGGGCRANEGVLPVARGGGGDRWWSLVVRLAAHAGAGAECTRCGRGGGRVPGLHAGVGLGRDRDHRVFGLRVPVLRVVRDGPDARDPRAADRHGQGAVALP